MRTTLALTALALVAAACGSGSTTSVGSASDQPAAVAAEANQPNLDTSGTTFDIEVLVVADGSVTTLAEAAIGDRPLLIWFWAPL